MPGLLGEEVAHVVDAGVEHRRARVDLGAVARREQHDLGQVLAERERRAAPWGDPPTGPSSARGARPGTVRWFSPTTTRDTSATAPSPRARRPARIRSSMPESRARRQSASSLERPPARMRFPGLGEQLEQRLVLGAHLVGQPWSRSQAARAGLRPPVPTVTTRSPRRTTDIRVNEQLAGSSAALHPDPAGLAGLEDRPVDRRGRSWRRWRARRRRGRRRRRPAPRPSGGPASSHARTSSPSSGATTWTSAPAARSASILRAAIRPAPTTTHRRPATRRFTG